VPEASDSLERGGRQRPATRRSIAEAVERVVKTRFPPVSLTHRGAPSPSVPAPSLRRGNGAPPNRTRASTRREPRDERSGESRLRRREHETHRGARRKDSECRRRFGRIVDRDAPEHARARSRTRADGLERLAHRAVTRATREKTSGIGAGISQHAAYRQRAEVRSNARKPRRAQARHGAGPGTRDVPRAASALDPETTSGWSGAWTCPL